MPVAIQQAESPSVKIGSKFNIVRAQGYFFARAGAAEDDGKAQFCVARNGRFSVARRRGYNMGYSVESTRCAFAPAASTLAD